MRYRHKICISPQLIAYKFTQLSITLRTLQHWLVILADLPPSDFWALVTAVGPICSRGVRVPIVLAFCCRKRPRGLCPFNSNYCQNAATIRFTLLRDSITREKDVDVIHSLVKRLTQNEVPPSLSFSMYAFTHSGCSLALTPPSAFAAFGPL